LLHVVWQFDLRKYFLTNHQVVGATWHQKRGVWDIQVKNLLSGDVFTDTAEIFVNNEGLLK
jgi:cation diffusion facilitator CzcD-associated flavoprotein CzcO